ncbi:30S ribosomal protein S21 [Candidatus Omnitrophota bacterium]
MIKVNVHEGQSLDDALKVFKRKCQKAKVIQDYKNKQRFEKRSDKKRRQRKERKKIARKVQRIMNKS